jgi:hypothetical protein
MKNRLYDLNNHLFEQIERLNDPELEGEALRTEIERSRAVSSIAKDITNNAKLVLDAKKLSLEYCGRKEAGMPKMLDGEVCQD